MTSLGFGNGCTAGFSHIAIVDERLSNTVHPFIGFGLIASHHAYRYTVVLSHIILLLQVLS